MTVGRKRGVAVIIVLGVLALLMVLAVAFSISMRVERAGAANYASAVNSRQLAWAGLAHAIQDLNAATPGYYPAGDFLVSRTSGSAAWNANGGSGVRLAVGQIRNYIPGLLRPVADTARSEWRRLRTDEGMGGHVAYLALNISDFLDVNYAGGRARGMGTNGAEVVLSGFSPAIDTNDLVRARDRYGMFMSLAEFRALTNVPTEVFTDFSRFARDYTRSNLVYIGGGVTNLQADAAEIKDRIRRRLLTDPQERPDLQTLNFIFDNLLDYVDEDSVPRNPDGPNGEAVPLLNEVALAQPRLTPTRLNSQIRVETWYPFSMPNRFGHTFQVRYDYTAEATIVEAGTTNTYTTSDTVTGNVPAPAPGSFRNTAQTFNLPLSYSTNNPVVTITIGVSNLRVRIAGSLDVADAATNVLLQFTYNGEAVAQPSMTPVSYEVTDPRLNWRTSDWSATNTASIGAINGMTQARWADPRYEGEYPLYISDLGRLYSPMELGNLLVPGPDRKLAPWSTFRGLNRYDGSGALVSARHPILEHFTTDEAELDTISIRRGLVHANTRDPALLAAAFREMPYPYGQAGGGVLSDALADAAAAVVANASAGGAVFTNVTGILEPDWRTGILAGLSDMELEAIAAYATSLLGVRQNLFLIVVSGTAAEEGMGVRGQETVRTQARQTALALVWRDPEPTLTGDPDDPVRWFDCGIRFFKWVND